MELALDEHLALLQSAVDAVRPHESIKQTFSPRLRAFYVASWMIRGLNAASFAAGKNCDLGMLLACLARDGARAHSLQYSVACVLLPHAFLVAVDDGIRAMPTGE